MKVLRISTPEIYLLRARNPLATSIAIRSLFSILLTIALSVGISFESHSQTKPETFTPGWAQLDSVLSPRCGSQYFTTVRWRFPTVVSTTGDTILGSIRFTYYIYQDDKVYRSLVYDPFVGRKESESSYSFISSLEGNPKAAAGYDYAITALLELPGYPSKTVMIGNPNSGFYPGINNDHNYACDTFYSKPSGDLSNVLTWGKNTNGSGENPAKFSKPEIFKLANRSQKYVMTSNWNIGDLVIPSNSQLEVNGFALRTERLTSENNTGTISGTPTSDWTVAGNGYVWVTPGAGDFNNFTVAIESISGQAFLNAPVNIYGTLTLQKAGTLVSLNADNLVLKSTARSTARVAQILNSSNQFVPDMPLTIERFIPARRAWRLLCAPVAMSQTVNDSWQEGRGTSFTNFNPNRGYGTLIFGGAPAAGFDYNYFHHGSYPVSLKKYNSLTDTWIPVPNTIATPVGNTAYMLFVRSHRGTEPFKEYGSENTVLRARGYLNCNDQTFTVEKNGFTAIPNPYASAINFATITRSNVQNNFYVWDPKLGGANGVGGYVLISFNGTGYDVIPAAVSEESQYIQSGQAFLVHSNGNAGSITIKESDKVSLPARDVFRTTSEITGSTISNKRSSASGIRITLQSVEKDNQPGLLDEVFSSYSADFSDKIDQFDAEKMPNVEENIAIVKDGHSIMAERSAALDRSDVIQLKVWNTTPGRNYQLEINPANIGANISTAFLTDNYLKTRTPIDLSKQTQIQFSATSEEAGLNTNRFNISFEEKTSIVAAASGISTFPNPVNKRIIQMRMSNQPKGNYKVQLYNSASQLVYSTSISHPGGTASNQIQFAKMPAPGKYFLQVANETSTNTMQIIVE